MLSLSLGDVTLSWFRLRERDRKGKRGRVGTKSIDLMAALAIAQRPCKFHVRASWPSNGNYS